MTTEAKTIARKLTVASLNINPVELIATMAEGESKVVASIIGRATHYTESPSRFDTTKTDVRFKGAFEGLNLLTGETVEATSCFLPGAAPDAVQAAIDGMGEDENAIDFAVLVSIKKQKKRDGSDGYVFGIAVPRQPEAADPLARMREQVKALASPQAAAIEAPKAKKEKAD